MFAHFVLATFCLATTTVIAIDDRSDAPAPTVADSGLAVFPNHVDLGDVAAGATTSSRAWIVNTALQPITINSAKPGCGCTTVPFTSVTLAPGEIHSFTFEVEAPTAVGKSKDIPITFRPSWGDVVTFTTTLTTVAPDGAPDVRSRSNVEEHQGPVALIPLRRHLGEVPGGTPIDTTAWIVNSGTAPAHISKIKAGCGCTEVIGFQPTSVAAGHAVPVRLRIKPKAKANPNKRIKITAVADDARLETTLAMRVVVAGKETAAK